MEQTRGIGSSRKSNFVNRSMYPTNRILCRFLLLLDDLSFLTGSRRRGDVEEWDSGNRWLRRVPFL